MSYIRLFGYVRAGDVRMAEITAIRLKRLVIRLVRLCDHKMTADVSEE